MTVRWSTIANNSYWPRCCAKRTEVIEVLPIPAVGPITEYSAAEKHYFTDLQGRLNCHVDVTNQSAVFRS